MDPQLSYELFVHINREDNQEERALFSGDYNMIFRKNSQCVENMLYF